MSWSLVVLLAAGAVLIRVGSELAQAVNALVFVGAVIGVALVAGLLWDGWLSATLIWAALPIKRSALQTLNGLVDKE